MMARMAGGRSDRAAALLLPGGMTVALSFSSGGYFPGATALAALLLAVLLLLRVLLAERPFEGFSARLAFGAAALVLFATWTLFSSVWSDSPSRALVEFDRVLLYLTALLLFGSFARRTETLRLTLWSFAAGVTVVCVAGLATRTLPDVWQIAPAVQEERLSYPIGYWNSLGLLAGLGCIVCLHLSSWEREPRIVRCLSAAAVPVLASTLFFTFSRGPLVALGVGLLAYVVLSRARLLLGAGVAILPPTALALYASYQAGLLASKDPTTAAAAAQGHDVALTLVVCAVLAGALRALLRPVDRRGWGIPRAPSRRTVGIAAAVATAIVAVVALSGPGVGEELGEQYDRAVRPDVRQTGDYRDRFTDPGLARLAIWKGAGDAFGSSPIVGEGAGTYELLWAQRRTADYLTADGHSLYLEVAAELGLVGLVLLGAALLAIVVALLVPLRGRARPLYGVLVATAATWLVHAGIDWDWEVPATTLWLFSVGGAVLAGEDGDRSELPAGWRAPGWTKRLPLAGAVLALAVPPALLALSQTRLTESLAAEQSGDCERAVDRARAALSVLDNRPEPYEVLAYCEARTGEQGRAVVAMERAVRLDPRNWEYHYGLALVRAAAGQDPRTQVRAALRLNPREATVKLASTRLGGSDPKRWRRAVAGLGLAPP